MQARARQILESVYKRPKEHTGAFDQSIEESQALRRPKTMADNINKDGQVRMIP